VTIHILRFLIEWDDQQNAIRAVEVAGDTIGNDRIARAELGLGALGP
jgi:hypothetical protein